MSRARSDPWPANEKQRALELAAETGFADASRATGIPAATIRKWAQRAKQAASVELVAQLDGLDWGQRRDRLVVAFGSGAAEAAEAARQAVKRGKASDARNFSIAAGVQVDKFLLLGGQATTRSETYSVNQQVGDDESYRESMDRQVKNMLDEFDLLEVRERERRIALVESEAQKWEAEIKELEGGDDRQGEDGPGVAPVDDAAQGPEPAA
jgi:transposase-like protein/uncharacterized small protein (DUF1192 family)